MRFQRVPPVPSLRGYVEKIWFFESSAPMRRDDMKLVVPNGRLLLVMAFRNGIAARMNGRDYRTGTHSLGLVGVCNHPSIVDAETDGPTGTIGVEISPAAAYRFFRLSLKELRDQRTSLADILGKAGRELERRLSDLEGVEEKVASLQQFLVALFTQREADPVFEHCIRKIEGESGGVQIRELEQATGYSSRWLNRKFEEQLGISPKNFSSIVRFQHYYQALLANKADFFKQKTFYLHYHDESHFIKEFKRFTGLSPAQLMRSRNEFGSMFYHE